MCDCITIVNRRLAADGTNTAVSSSFIVKPYHIRVRLEVARIDPRGPAAQIVAPIFCPFCGQPYLGAGVDSAVGDAGGRGQVDPLDNLGEDHLPDLVNEDELEAAG
jgi:hypothetical protein